VEQTPGGPGPDLPSLNTVSIARGYGCDAAPVEDISALKKGRDRSLEKANTDRLGNSHFRGGSRPDLGHLRATTIWNFSPLLFAAAH
jgi:hypothetical protein